MRYSAPQGGVPPGTPGFKPDQPIDLSGPPVSLALKGQGRLSMSAGFWLSERAWAAIEPLLSTNQPVARRVYDRRVISGISGVVAVMALW